jgi:F-type H+-transporting ATPase subunit gamma
MLMEKFISEIMIKLNWYNQFKNAATQIVQTEQFLPLAAVQSDLTTSVGDYIFEPSKKRLSWLIPKSLKTQLYKAIRDSFASEHGARMTAIQGNRQCDWFEKRVEIDIKPAKLR